MKEAEGISFTKKQNNRNLTHRLPDELLISIVSLLSVKEGARTSVLARRWRYVWMFSRILNFDGLEIVHELVNFGNYYSLRVKTGIFADWVNKVLSSHSGETIDGFGIRFSLDKNNASEIDRWIEFALRKRVRKLELNFQSKVTDWSWSSIRYQKLQNGAYTFPNVERLNILALGLSLVSLSLTRVDVTGEILDSFISNCSALEDLHIENSKGLYSFRPSCQATQLRRLAIINCKDLGRIEICSPNLVSYALSAFDAYTPTVLNGVSSLIHLSLGALMDFELRAHLHDLSGCLSRLETLTLHIMIAETRMRKYPSLPRLKKLVLHIDISWKGGDDCSILQFTPLINAAPLLHEIVLKLIGVSYGSSRRPQRPAMGQKHECLKVLEIVGYAGIAVDVEMALYVLENAASLEKVVIDGVAKTGEDLHLLKRKLLAIVAAQDFVVHTKTIPF